MHTQGRRNIWNSGRGGVFWRKRFCLYYSQNRKKGGGGHPSVPLVSTVMMLPRPTLETLLQRSCKLIWPETVKIIKVKYLTLKYWLRKCSSFLLFAQMFCSKKLFTFSSKSKKLRIFWCLFWLRFDLNTEADLALTPYKGRPSINQMNHRVLI